MPRKIKKILNPLSLALAILICAAVSANAQTKVQTVFNLESEMRKQVSIPAAVIAILKSDERVGGCFEKKGAGANESKWFAASAIDLNGDGRDDLVIKAAAACLYGANQGPFWIFANLTDGYQKILTADGLQLAVLPKKSNSFNQIKISKVVRMKPASEIFSYKTGEYQSGARRR